MPWLQSIEELAEKVDRLFESKKAHAWIISLVLINAIVFGLDSIPYFKEKYESVLGSIDTLILSIFILELVTRLIVTRGRFFRNDWNIFDLFVTLISLLPAHYGLTSIRVLRVLHCLRILELLPKTKHILDGLAHSFTGIINVVSICFVFFYVFGLMATDMFNEWDPQNFGNLGASLLSLFTLMASGGVTDLKDIYTAHPVAWVLIISFVVIMSYFILNLVIGVIVGAMAKAEDEIEAIGGPSVYEKAIMDMGQELNLLRNEIADLKKELTQQGK